MEQRNLNETSVGLTQDEWRRVCLRALENLPHDTSVTMGDIDAILTWCLPEYDRIKGRSDSEPEVEVPANVAMLDLEPWEQRIWRTPGLSVEERKVTILLIRLRRGALNDDTKGLRALHTAIGETLAKYDDTDIPEA